MATVISFVNSKGGVGKTTLTYNLAFAIQEHTSSNCLLIDLDSQGSLSSTFLDDIHDLNQTLADILPDDGKPISDAIIDTEFDGIDLVPANLDLEKINIHLAADVDAQYYLADKLEDIDGDYDFVIMDCPPYIGLVTRMALTASHGIIIPLEAASYSVRSTGYIHELVQKVQKRANPQLEILGYTINRFDGRRKVEQQYAQLIFQNFGPKMFETIIKDSAKYCECVADKKPITQYQKTSEQAEAVRKLASEILERIDG
jgi:chromosome partitioning protein